MDIKFQRCDLVSWKTNEKTIGIGIFWDDTPNILCGKNKILYPSENTYDSDILFPADNEDLITEYISNLAINQKISSKYSLQKRISEDGITIISLVEWTIPGSYKVVKKPDWDSELIGCPSQCYCKFLDKTKNKIYCIYLRWRWSDPWSSELIPCQEDGELSYSRHEPWIVINTKRNYSEPEHEKLQKETVNWVKKNYSDIFWLQS